MRTKKLKEELHETENQNSDDLDYCAAVPADFAAKKKTKKKRRNIVQLESKAKDVSRKPKSLKSKDKQGSEKSKKSASNARKRTRYCDLYDDVEAQFSVLERADRVLAHLENNAPCFAKCMLPSNVAHGFWLHLPKKFCSIHLPNHDTSIVLVDEWGNEYKTSYLLVRHGLSAGWRGFSIAHRLLKGDILIFHLIEPCKLKVHIVRVNDANVVCAALCLMEMDASWRGLDDDDVKKDERKRKRTKYVEPFLLGNSSPLANFKRRRNMPNLNLDHAKAGASNSDGFCSEVIEGSDISKRLFQSNDLFYSRTSVFRDHSREGVTCR